MHDCDWCTESSVVEFPAAEGGPKYLCCKHFSQQARDAEIERMNKYLETGYPKPVRIPVGDGHGNHLFDFDYYPEGE